MQLAVTTFLSADGIYQGPGGPDEDRSGGFDRGGWLVPNSTRRPASSSTRSSARWTRFSSAGAPTTSSPPPGRTPPIRTTRWRTASTRCPKYVASTTLKDPKWANTTVLEGDLASAVRELKQREGRELQVHGSGTLVRFLLDDDLVDRLNLLVFPVIVGAGRRLFPDQGIATDLALDESRTTPSGVTISVYRPTGRPEFGSVEVT